MDIATDFHAIRQEQALHLTDHVIDIIAGVFVQGIDGDVDGDLLAIKLDRHPEYPWRDQAKQRLHHREHHVVLGHSHSMPDRFG
jgi:hypothetical protein